MKILMTTAAPTGADLDFDEYPPDLTTPLVIDVFGGDLELREDNPPAGGRRRRARRPAHIQRRKRP